MKNFAHNIDLKTLLKLLKQSSNQLIPENYAFIDENLQPEESEVDIKILSAKVINSIEEEKIFHGRFNHRYISFVLKKHFDFM